MKLKLLGKPFLIADCSVDPANGSITRDGACTKLEPMAMALLVYLARHHGDVISRSELDEHVWPETVVSDNSFGRLINRLREALGDDYDNPQYIQAIPNKGYRLIASMQPVPNPSKKSSTKKNALTGCAFPTYVSFRFLKGYRPHQISRIACTMVALFTVTLFISVFHYNVSSDYKYQSTLQLPELPSIAILPLWNTSADRAQDYISDGLSAEIITILSHVTELFVIARSSAFQYQSKDVDIPTVAKKLGVRFVLYGSVQNANDRIRFKVHLADNQARRTIWSKHYDDSNLHLFQIQNKVAGDTLEAIRLQLGTQAIQMEYRATTGHAEAYDAFLKGWQLVWQLSPKTYAKAEAHLKHAIDLDVDYSPAYAALALIYWKAWQYQWQNHSANPNATWIQAKKAIARSILQPSALAYSIKSAMQLYQKRYKDAIKLAQQAIDINGNSAYAYLTLANALAFDGQSKLAIQYAEKGLRLDPLSPTQYLAIKARALFDLGNPGQAAKILLQSRRSNPRDSESRIILLASFGHLNQREEAGYVLAELNLSLKRQGLGSFSTDPLKHLWPYRERDKLDYLIEGLKKAGVPER